jgi:peroxiredoxin
MGNMIPARTRTIAPLVTLVCATAVVAGCGTAAPTSAPPTSAPTTTATTSTDAATTTTTAAVPPGPSASPATGVPAVLDFRATTVDGTAFSGADLAGHRTVLWFWAPWCTVCARAAADVKRDAAALGPDVRVVGVAGLSSDAAGMRGFVDRGGLQSMTHLADTGGDLYARFGVTQQDTFVLIRPDGTVSRHPSYSQDIDLVALARQTFG